MVDFRRPNHGNDDTGGFSIHDLPLPIGSKYAIYGNMDPINIPPLC